MLIACMVATVVTMSVLYIIVAYIMVVEPPQAVYSLPEDQSDALARRGIGELAQHCPGVHVRDRNLQHLNYG